MTTDQLRKQIKKLPISSGIYFFKDSKNKPLYIGKALDLKNRLKSYLQTDDPRLQRMIFETKKVDIIETEGDIEALILESQYIKKYQPSFNITLRDDKQYGFVGFTEEEFPKIFITHQPHSKFRNIDISSFIGPFTDMSALKTTLRLLRKIFPYCTCKQTHHNYCLNYHINKCLGYCCLKDVSRISYRVSRIYKNNIRAIQNTLSGKKMSLIKNFEKEMHELGKKGKFEEALELQYKIEKLKKVFQNAQIIGNWKLKIGNSDADKEISKTLQQLHQLLSMSKPPRRIEAYDIANIQGQYAVGAMVVFTNGKPDKNQYRKFKINMFGFTTSKHMGGDTGMLKEVLTRRFNHPEWPMPDLMLVDGGKAQLNATSNIIASYHLPITLVALTKNEKHMGEKIFIQNKKEVVPLSRLPINVKNLLLQIDSEAHRFAISYYRKLHRKKALRPY